MTDEDMPRPAGPCCVCGKPFPEDSVVNVWCLDFKGPQPGKGWGCVVCGLPMDGAIAVICDACVHGDGKVTTICYGFPIEAGRVSRERYVVVPFAHDRKKHEEDGSWPGSPSNCSSTAH